MNNFQSSERKYLTSHPCLIFTFRRLKIIHLLPPDAITFIEKTVCIDLVFFSLIKGNLTGVYVKEDK